MNDAVLLSEIVAALFDGIVSASDTRINRLYERYGKSFPELGEMNRRIDHFFEYILSWRNIHQTVVIKPYNFYSLALAITHHLNPVASLQEYHSVERPSPINGDYALPNIGILAAAQEDPEAYRQVSAFIEACSCGTNRINQRRVRFQYYSRALEPALL